ncbi:MAG: hypothetical protein LLG01_09095 [Planctomycetaceae bacterium]|nr:hypothetical protein [Planctomycetaceae bacterium]
MLGRLRRTTRFDVALALSFAGFAYLAWAAATGVGRWMLATVSAAQGQNLPSAVIAGRAIFVDAALGMNLAGLVWLCVSLALVVRASRQRCSITWAWMSTACQILVAAGAAILAGVACRAMIPAPQAAAQSAWDLANALSLPVLLAVAVLVWVTFLVWLLVERARMDRYGPTLRDGLRTNVYR